MEEDLLPWPQSGDKLFEEGSDWWNNAVTDFRPGDWYPYVEGYRRAADVLVQHVAKHRSDTDLLVYPIAFLYRHYLELHLKTLIQEGSKLQESQPKPRHTHDLGQLWQECRSVLEGLSTQCPEADLDAVEACIRELSEIDPRSMAFRYPVDKTGSPSCSQLGRVSLRQMAEVMARLAGLLDAIETEADLELEFRQQMAAEYGDVF